MLLLLLFVCAVEFSHIYPIQKGFVQQRGYAKPSHSPWRAFAPLGQLNNHKNEGKNAAGASPDADMNTATLMLESQTKSHIINFVTTSWGAEKLLVPCKLLSWLFPQCTPCRVSSCRETTTCILFSLCRCHSQCVTSVLVAIPPA